MRRTTFYWLNCFLLFYRFIKRTHFQPNHFVKPKHLHKSFQRIIEIGKFSSKFIIWVKWEAVVKAYSEQTYFGIFGVSNLHLYQDWNRPRSPSKIFSRISEYYLHYFERWIWKKSQTSTMMLYFAKTVNG